MNSYEQWLQKAEDAGLSVVENAPFESQAKGLICGGCIGLNQDMETTMEKTCVLAEELGHYYTTAGDILNVEKSENQKQEYRARLWAYNEKIGLSGLVAAYRHGCQNSYEVSEYLDVTEEFLHEALTTYRNKYGISKQIDNYVIYFEPHLCIMELLQ